METWEEIKNRAICVHLGEGQWSIIHQVNCWRWFAVLVKRGFVKWDIKLSLRVLLYLPKASLYDAASYFVSWQVRMGASLQKEIKRGSRQLWFHSESLNPLAGYLPTISSAGLISY